MRAAYLIADLIYLLLYKLGKYRRKIVRHNLRTSFPDMNEKEMLKVERQFYHNLDGTRWVSPRPARPNA